MTGNAFPIMRSVMTDAPPTLRPRRLRLRLAAGLEGIARCLRLSCPVRDVLRPVAPVLTLPPEPGIVYGVGPDITLADAVVYADAAGLRGVPVVDRSGLLGWLELALDLGEDRILDRTADHIQHGWRIGPDAPASDARRMLGMPGAPSALCVVEGGRLLGVVTLGDLDARL